MQKLFAIILVFLIVFSGLAAGEDSTASTDLADRRERTEKTDTTLNMPQGEAYSKLPIGVITFRSDAFRQNAACGTVPVGIDRMVRSAADCEMDEADTGANRFCRGI